MSARADGGPAFPTTARVGNTALSEGGLTLRDYFAAKAMQALISTGEEWTKSGAAKAAYTMADAMLAAREEGGAA